MGQIMEVKQLTIREFSTKIKEEGVDYKIVNITPSLSVDEDLFDILDFIREYRDRVNWDNITLRMWLKKHNFIKEFEEYYSDWEDEYVDDTSRN